MSTHTCLTYHLVFSTKYRRPTIDDSWQQRLCEYVGGIIRGQNGCLIEMGGVEDHVHILANLAPTLAVSDAIREIKTNSSKWVSTDVAPRSHFQWQKGYGAFSVSHSSIERVKRYIRNQPEHHRHTTFHDEYVEFLTRHKIKYDPKFLFEHEYHG